MSASSENFPTSVALVILLIVVTLKFFTFWMMPSVEDVDWAEFGIRFTINTYLLVMSSFLCAQIWQQSTGAKSPLRPWLFWVTLLTCHYFIGAAFGYVMIFTLRALVESEGISSFSTFITPLTMLMEPLPLLIQGFTATGIALFVGGKGPIANGQSVVAETVSKVFMVSIGAYLAVHIINVSAVWYTQERIPTGYIDLGAFEISVRAAFQFGNALWALVAMIIISVLTWRLVSRMSYSTTFIMALIVSSTALAASILSIRILADSRSFTTLGMLAIFFLTFSLTSCAASMTWVRFSNRGESPPIH